MTGDVVDLRRYRIRYAAEVTRRAGYRTTPPPDAEADRWVFAVEAGEGEDGRSRHRLLWIPREAAENWQRARFGGCEPLGAKSEQRGQKGKGTAASVTPLPRAE